MRRVEYCILGDDVAAGALAAACAATGPTAWIRGSGPYTAVRFEEFSFPLLPPVSFCAAGREGFRPARGEIRVGEPGSTPHRRQWAIGSDLLAMFRDLEGEHPGDGPALVDLYRRVQRPSASAGAATAWLPGFLHPFGQGVGMFFGHTPLAAASFQSLANSLGRMGPATYSPQALLREAEQAVTAAGGFVLSGVQVNAFGRASHGVELVNEEPLAAGRIFLGNSEYLWRVLAGYTSDLFPILGYGVLKKAKGNLDFLLHWRDAERPPVEENFAFCAVLPWVKGEGPFGEGRVIFGLNSSAFYWRKDADRKSAQYRASLETWLAENFGDVKVLGWLTPPEVAVHPLRFTVPTGSFLTAEPAFDSRRNWRRALPPGVHCLLNPGFFTGEIAGWLGAADAVIRRLPPPPRRAEPVPAEKGTGTAGGEPVPFSSTGPPDATSGEPVPFSPDAGAAHD